MSALAQAPVTYQYVYDSAGRLTEAIDSSGNALQYVYDAAGNLTAIQHLIGVQIAITGASTETGVAGEQVTFTGLNLGDCTPTVMFNGVSATVVSNTTNSVTVTIPAGATSGPVTITNCHGTATSTFTFTIGEVDITPPLAIVQPGISVQFSASVLPSASSKAVVWSVDGIVGGSSAVGTITASGLYSVPAAASGVITIEATSVANPLLVGSATVRIVNTVDFNAAFSPGVSVLLNTSNIGANVPVYVASPPVSILLNTSNIGANTPVYVVSPGVSILLNKTSIGANIPVYVVSPGVSVLLNTTPIGANVPVYVASSPVSVQLNAISVGKAIPVFVFSPGVSVTNLTPTTGADQGTIYIVSPGVSVVRAPQTGQTLPPKFKAGPVIADIQPFVLHTGTETVTVAGTGLDAARAVGFLDDAGHLDTNIAVKSAVISPSGQAMTLHLTVGRKAAPGRRHIVFWSMPHQSQPAVPGR